MEQKNTGKYKAQREEKLKEISKERLYNNCKKKILTTMIGALATIEKNLTFLVDEDPAMKQVLDAIRSEILDKGNTQIRNLEIEFANYDVMSKKTNIVIPFIGR